MQSSEKVLRYLVGMMAEAYRYPWKYAASGRELETSLWTLHRTWAFINDQEKALFRLTLERTPGSRGRNWFSWFTGGYGPVIEFWQATDMKLGVVVPDVPPELWWPDLEP